MADANRHAGPVASMLPPRGSALLAPSRSTSTSRISPLSHGGPIALTSGRIAFLFGLPLQTLPGKKFTVVTDGSLQVDRFRHRPIKGGIHERPQQALGFDPPIIEVFFLLATVCPEPRVHALFDLHKAMVAPILQLLYECSKERKHLLYDGGGRRLSPVRVVWNLVDYRCQTLVAALDGLIDPGRLDFTVPCVFN